MAPPARQRTRCGRTVAVERNSDRTPKTRNLAIDTQIDPL